MHALFFLLAFCYFCYINPISSCYITNCPLSIKRDKLDDAIARYCRTCANGLGMCFGPRTCCGPDIGCLVDTKVSQVCETEDIKYATPCLPFGKSCSQIIFGKCATKNLCCNPESCVFDENCNEENMIEFMDLNVDDETFSTSSDQRNGIKIEKKLKLALKHLLHNTKQQKRIKFEE